jgi:2-oxoglutarate dehydrogenase E1 component
LFCSGKIYYDLYEKREDLKISDVVIIRIEQLDPFPAEQLREILSAVTQAREWIWVQEEPKNMGAWSFVQPLLQPLIGGELGYVGRAAAASPATGYLKLHKEQQAALVQQALGV